MKFRLPRIIKNSTKGFTLIELLIVIAIISALAIAVFVALNPAQRVKDANNARRSTDVDTALSAVHTHIVDNNGDLPSGLPTAERMIGTGDAVACAVAVATGGCNVPADTACYDLAGAVPNYISSNPIDPESSSWSSTRTGYSIKSDALSGIVTVTACAAQDTTVSASR